jgi:FkbM family methyltransferase
MGLISISRFITGHPLNRRHKCRALGRFVRYQLAKRLMPGEFIVPFVDGSRLILSPNSPAATGNYYGGLIEFSDMSFVIHTLRPDDFFVDVGANIGSFTTLASVVSKAKCLSFEPTPITYARLMDNIRLNGTDDRVEARCQGVGGKAGTLRFIVDQGPTNHILQEGEPYGGAVEEVSVVTLDDAVGDRTPTVIKIDVEGFESFVIDGAQGLLSRLDTAALILEFNGRNEAYGAESSDLHQRLISFGFKPYHYRPFERTLVGVDTAEPGLSGNIIYLKNPEFYIDRVKSAEPFTVLGQKI